MLLGQGLTQQILRKHLEAFGTTVETETELREYKQDAEGVTATLVKYKGGEETTETVRLRYLVGTDGGKSASCVSDNCAVFSAADVWPGIIRKSLGLSFEGKALNQGIIMGELQLEGLDRDVCTTLLFLRPSSHAPHHQHWHRWADWQSPTMITYVLLRTLSVAYPHDLTTQRDFPTDGDPGAVLLPCRGPRRL